MPRLSIVIPVCGNLKRLEDTLVSVLENRPEDSEILVVLDDAYDDPYDLKDEIRFIEAPRRAGLAAILDLGIEASQASVVHVLACGTQVHEGWTEAVLPHFADPWIAAVAPLVVDTEDPERIVSAGLTYRCGGQVCVLGRGRPLQAALEDRTPVLGPLATAAFYRKSALEAIGRFCAMADEDLIAVDTALRLAYAGFRTVREPRCKVRAEQEPRRRRGALRRALHAERLFWRWAPCFGWLRSLPAHAACVTLEMLRSLFRLTFPSELAGRTLGLAFLASGWFHARHVKRLREAARAAVAAAGAPHFRPGIVAKDGEAALDGAQAQSARLWTKKAAV